MTITPSSGLSRDEIDKMVRDAQAHSADDKKKREDAEVRNQGDTLVYATERAIQEHGDKVDAQTRKAIEDTLNDLKEALKGGQTDRIRKTSEALAKASMKLGEAMYAKAGKGGKAGEAGGEAAPEGDKGGENVVDAEFKPDGEDKKKG